MHERTNIQLSAIDRSALEAVVANRNSAQKHVWRAKIVLMTADGYGTAEIMRCVVASGGRVFSHPAAAHFYKEHSMSKGQWAFRPAVLTH